MSADDHFNLEDAYSVSTPEENKALYARWAATYDAEFVSANDYVYPIRVAEKAVEILGDSASIEVVDVGCGTGALGSLLGELRPNWEIDGVDISLQMLAVAATKVRSDGLAVYRDLLDADLTKPIQFAKNHFDLIVSSGVFTHGHLAGRDLIAISSAAREGGTIVVGINKEHYDNVGFDGHFAEAVSEGLISEPQFTEVDIYGPSSPHFGDKGLIAVFTRLEN
ncbi:MAG: class I SAM-dependent DNA methyltransferase [Ilumatobacteraceae bacterium]